MDKQTFLNRFLFHNRQNVSDLRPHPPFNLNKQGLKKSRRSVAFDKAPGWSKPDIY